MHKKIKRNLPRAETVGLFMKGFSWMLPIDGSPTYIFVKFNQPDRENEEQDLVLLEGGEVAKCWYDKTGKHSIEGITQNDAPMVNGEHDFFFEGLTLSEYVQALVMHPNHLTVTDITVIISDRWSIEITFEDR